MGLDELAKHVGGSLAGKAAAIVSGASATVNDYGRDKAIPAIDNIVGETSKFLDDFSKDKLVPAVDYIVVETTKAVDGIDGERLKEAGAAVNDFKEAKLDPTLKKTGAALDEFGREKVIPAVEKGGKWAAEHPGETAVIVGSGLTIAFPNLISAPILWIFGLGGAGVRAGSAAAAVQSSIGNVAGKSAFATLQSSAMGGYGTAIMNGIVRAGAAIFGGLGLGSAA